MSFTDDHFREADIAIKSLLQSKKEISEEELNEAETRYHFIDKIIHEVMGFQDILCVRREQPIKGNKYYDYLLKDSQGRSLIAFEAKKEDISFEIDKVEKINTKRLKTSKKNKKFFKAIEQSVNYARIVSAPFAMVSNGFQIAIVKSNAKIGEPEEYGAAIVFHSLEDIQNRLEDFLQILSFNSLNQSYPKLNEVLSIRDNFLGTPSILKTLIPDYPRYHYFDYHNEEEKKTAESLKHICSALIHGLDKEAFKKNKTKEFLENCYVTPSEYSAKEFTYMQKEFTNEYERSIDATVQHAMDYKGINKSLLEFSSADPLVILGNIGVGKSTFIDYLIHNSTTFDQYHCIARINFVNFITIDDKSIKESTAESLYQALKRSNYDCKEDSKLRDIYAADVAQTKKHYRNCSDEQIAEKIGDLLERKKSDLVQLIKDAVKRRYESNPKARTIVFLDNVDQKSTSIQRNIYEFARELMNSWGVDMSCIPMTPLAFHNAQHNKIFRSPKSTGHTNVFTIVSPPVDRIFSKRIEFLRRLYKDDRLQEYGFPYSLSHNLPCEYLNVIGSEITKEDISNTIGMLCGGNIRSAIDIVKEYIESSWTEVIKWERIKKEHFVISKINEENIFRAILKGSKYDYDDENNQYLMNIFSISENDPREHLLGLGLLYRMSTTSNATGGYYHNLKDLLEWGRSHGFGDDQIYSKLKAMESMILIEPSDLVPDFEGITSSSSTKSYRIKPRGIFHMDAINRYEYIVEITKVTPILIDKFYAKFSNKDPRENVPVFLEYLTFIIRDSNVSDNFFPHSILRTMYRNLKII